MIVVDVFDFDLLDSLQKLVNVEADSVGSKHVVLPFVEGKPHLSSVFHVVKDLPFQGLRKHLILAQPL